MRKPSRTLVLIVAAIVAIGLFFSGLIYFSGQHDPVLSSARGPSSNTFSLRRTFQSPTTAGEAPIADGPPDASSEPQRVDPTSPIATSEPTLSAGKTVAAHPSIGNTTALAIAKDGKKLELIEIEDKDELMAPNKSVDNLVDAPPHQEKQSDVEASLVETVPVEESIPFEPETAPYNPYREVLMVQKRANGVESFPHLKRYQTHSYRSGCVEEDVRTSKADVTRRFKRALQLGGFCEEKPVSVETKMIFEAIFEATMSRLPGFFIEHSSNDAESSVSHMLSAGWPSLPVIFQQLPASGPRSSSSLDKNPRYCHKSLPDNVLLSLAKSDSSVEFGVMDCYQYVEGYDSIVRGMLPFELEEYLGQLLCQCNTTWMPIALPTDPYFAAWTNSTELLSGAMRTAKDTCAYTLQMPPTPSYGGRNKPIPTTHSHFSVHRVDFNIQTTSGVQSELKRSFSYSERQRRSKEDSKLQPSRETENLSPFRPEVLNQLTLQHLLSLNLNPESIINVLSTFAFSNDAYSHCDARQQAIPARCSFSDDQHIVKYVLRNNDIRILPKFFLSAKGQFTIGPETSINDSDVKDIKKAVSDSGILRWGNKAYPEIAFNKRRLFANAGTFSLLNSSNVINPVARPVDSLTPAIDRGPTKRPSAGPVVSKVSDAISGNNLILGDIELRFNAPGSASASRPFSSPPERFSSGNFRYSKHGDLANVGDAVAEWMFPGSNSNQNIHIYKSKSINDGVFDSWIAREESMASSSKSNAQSFLRPSAGTEMSELGRLSMRSLRDREREHLQRWVSLLLLDQPIDRDKRKQRNLKSSRIAKSDLVFVFGKYISMLSVKIAQVLKSRGSVISIHSDSLSLDSHTDLLTMFDLEAKNVICHNPLDLLEVAAISASTERASVSIYQADVFVRLLHHAFSALEPYHDVSNKDDDDGQEPPKSGSDRSDQSCVFSFALLEESFGALVDIAVTTYVELPIFEKTAAMVAILAPKCSDAFIGRYNDSGSFLRRSVETINSRNGVFNVTESPVLGHETGPLLFIIRREAAHSDNYIGLSLYRLLHLQPSSSILKDLFKLYLEIPSWLIKSDKSKIMLPWNLFVSFMDDSGMTLTYRPEEGSSSGGIELSSEFIFEHNSNPLHETAGSDSFGARYKKSSNFAAFADARAARAERTRAHYFYDVLLEEFEKRPGELAGGKFSIVEHNSGSGYLSALLSHAYPNATVISIEASENKVAKHVQLLEELNIQNNAVCRKPSGEDSAMFKNLYESPELFRFQVLTQGLLESFRDSDNLIKWGTDVGSMLSNSLTSFVNLPLSEVVSQAMYMFFDSFETSYGFGRGPIRQLKEVYGDNVAHGSAHDEILSFESTLKEVSLSEKFIQRARASKCSDKTVDTVVDNRLYSRLSIEDASDLIRIWNHPTRKYEEFETALLLAHARAPAGSTKVQVTSLTYGENLVRSSMFRIDIINMTRGVHHHYDYAKDGHKRTYTMYVSVNETQSADVAYSIGDPSAAMSLASRDSVTLISRSDGRAIQLLPGSHPNRNSIVTVHLMRASTVPFYIPYTSLYGVTLITALRLGLETSQREKMFSTFINLPLYEDMAPWNIVLMGQGLDYIDYDTRDVTFDKFVPKAYQVMSVLMNYKRTVEDFKRCAGKAPTVYGIAFISDCVGSSASSKSLKCDDLSKAVPCPDGECHSDYISCLRSLSYQASLLTDKSSVAEGSSPSDMAVMRAMSDAMRAHTGLFNENGLLDNAE